MVFVEQRVGQDLYLCTRERSLADHAHQLANVHATVVANYHKEIKQLNNVSSNVGVGNMYVYTE